jgi:hypothetical protein
MSRSTGDVRVRLGAIALAVTGVLFILYPATRPYSDEKSLAAATAYASAAWIAAHLFAVVGFILLTLGLLALRVALSGTPGQRLASTAATLTWVGVGLVLPYYGAEIFGLYAIGRRALDDHNPALVDMANTVRYNPAAMTIFGVGLLLLAAGAVLAAVAVWRAGTLPRWSGVPLAAGYALFLPQFFGPPAVRVAHGVLVGIGCAWVALELWRVQRA